MGNRESKKYRNAVLFADMAFQIIGLEERLTAGLAYFFIVCSSKSPHPILKEKAIFSKTCKKKERFFTSQCYSWHVF